tara:strand:+ start:546 stop:1439 length:894 start_codon:yes stop_codon:yes gene_type:complete
MNTLGEKLAEARMKKGLSIQECSEQTKIRVSFLEAFEQDNFDIDLPDIYKKGFMKNYAELLGLDPDGTARELGSSSKGARQGRRREANAGFGSVSLGNSSAPSQEPEAALDATKTETTSKPVASSRTENQGFKSLGQPRIPDSDENKSKSGDRMIFAAVGVSVAAVLVVVVFLTWMFTADRNAEADVADNTPTPPTQGNVGEQGPTGTATPEPAPAPQPAAVPMEIMARNGAVDIVLIDKNTQQRVLEKSLAVGESVSVDKRGPLTIIYTNGDNVFVSLKGQTFKMPRSGPGRSMIP